MFLNSDLKCAKRPMDVLFKETPKSCQTHEVSAGLQAFLKSAAALFAQLQIDLHNSLQIILFSGISNKWLTRREPSSGKAPPPLEPAEKC